MTIKNKITTLILMMSCSLAGIAQVGIGTSTPNANSALEIVSTSQGMLLPRMTTAQRNAIASPATGLTIFNTSLDCIQTNIGTAGSPNWKCVQFSYPSTNGFADVSAYSCSGSSVGAMTTGSAVSGVTQTITATVTTVGTYSISTTANGVTFAASGTFAGTGAQTIVLTATGTPTAAGSNTFTLNTTPNCSFSRTVSLGSLPANITLSSIGTYFIASVYDQDYLPYSAPTVAASLATAQAADGTPESFTLDVQGSLTTGGVTLKIPYTVSSGTVSLPAFSQTINVPASYTEDGISRDVTFSYDAASLTGSGTINATLKAVGGTLNAKKLDLQTGIGNDYLGYLLAQFTYATNNSIGTANFQFRNIAPIPDRNIADAAHRMFYMPVLGADGKTWLNNNLGANYANITNGAFNPATQATGSNDQNAYGSSFQWGRNADGHELMNWTSASAGQALNTPITGTSSSTAPGNSFLKGYDNWYTGSNPNTLWQGINGTNNPCPFGYRLPTETELNNQRLSWSANSTTGAHTSPLKLPMAGQRSNYNTFSFVGSRSYYWSSSVSTAVNTASVYLYVNNPSSVPFSIRSYGFSVRCIKD
jgi:uncharacterized protein (TIGR02145 family)